MGIDARNQIPNQQPQEQASETDSINEFSFTTAGDPDLDSCASTVYEDQTWGNKIDFDKRPMRKSKFFIKIFSKHETEIQREKQKQKEEKKKKKLQEKEHQRELRMRQKEEAKQRKQIEREAAKRQKQLKIEQKILKREQEIAQNRALADRKRLKRQENEDRKKSEILQKQEQKDFEAERKRQEKQAKKDRQIQIRLQERERQRARKEAKLREQREIEAEMNQMARERLHNFVRGALNPIQEEPEPESRRNHTVFDEVQNQRDAPPDYSTLLSPEDQMEFMRQQYFRELVHGDVHGQDNNETSDSSSQDSDDGDNDRTEIPSVFTLLADTLVGNHLKTRRSGKSFWDRKYYHEQNTNDTRYETSERKEEEPFSHFSSSFYETGGASASSRERNWDFDLPDDPTPPDTPPYSTGEPSAAPSWHSASSFSLNTASEPVEEWRPTPAPRGGATVSPQREGPRTFCREDMEEYFQKSYGLTDWSKQNYRD